MTPRSQRFAKLSLLVLTLCLMYLALWPGAALVATLKPTLLSLAFSVLGEFFGVAAWPV
jgi:hypothetical protein